MKRSVVFAFALLSMVYSGAQIVKSIGIKSGVSLANQTWYYKAFNLPVHHSVKAGMYSAVSLEFLKGKYLSFATDLAYVEKGNVEILPSVTSGPYSNADYVRLHTRFAYFSVSPMVKARYEFKHVVPYVLLGGRLDQQLFYTSDNDYSSIEKDFNKTIWGLTMGAGVAWKLDKWTVSMEGLAHRDLSLVMDSPVTENYGGIRVNNRAIIINFGLHYTFSPKAAK